MLARLRQGNGVGWFAEAEFHHVVPRQKAGLEFASLLLNQMTCIITKPDFGIRGGGDDHEFVVNVLAH